MQGLPKMWLHCGSLTAKWTSSSAAATAAGVCAAASAAGSSASRPRSGSAAREYVCWYVAVSIAGKEIDGSDRS